MGDRDWGRIGKVGGGRRERRITENYCVSPSGSLVPGLCRGAALPGSDCPGPGRPIGSRRPGRSAGAAPGGWIQGLGRGAELNYPAIYLLCPEQTYFSFLSLPKIQCNLVQDLLIEGV